MQLIARNLVFIFDKLLSTPEDKLCSRKTHLTERLKMKITRQTKIHHIEENDVKLTTTEQIVFTVIMGLALAYGTLSPLLGS